MMRLLVARDGAISVGCSQPRFRARMVGIVVGTATLMPSDRACDDQRRHLERIAELDQLSCDRTPHRHSEHFIAPLVDPRLRVNQRLGSTHDPDISPHRLAERLPIARESRGVDYRDRTALR